MTTTEAAAAGRPDRGSSSEAGAVLALARRAFLDARVRTFAFGYVFALYAYVQPFGFRRAYPKLAERVAFAHSFTGNTGLRLLYGDPRDVETVSGYTAWRVGGTLAIAAAIFGLLAAVRALRAEEESGRVELVLAGVVGRGTLFLSALAAIGAGVLLLWAGELAGFLVAGLPAASSAYLALATASVAAVCVGVGAAASQLAATRRLALALGGSAVALLFLLRVVADTTSGTGWLRWVTPLGWAEELRPFAGAQPLVLLLPLVTTVLLLAVAARLSSGRDIGTGLVPARDSASPRLRLLSSPTAQALRTQIGTLLAWTSCIAVFGYILGVVSNSVSSADVSANIQKQIAKLGSGSITTPTGYLAFIFIFYTVAIAGFACTQIGAAHEAEADQQLETLLALPISRSRWLAGRLLLASAAAAALALAAGLATWAGAASAHAHVSLARTLEASANTLPIAILFLGLAATTYGLLPRASTAIAYGLLTVAFLWRLVGSLLGTSRWLLDLTPFAHVALVPVQPFRPAAAAVMIALGLGAALTGIARFGQRDLVNT